MALFNLSNDWDTNQTGEDLCETFLKDTKSHRKKHSKKEKRKAKQNSLNRNNSISNQSESITNRDKNDIHKKLEGNKQVLKKIKKKIEHLHVKGNKREDEKKLLTSFYEKESLPAIPAEEIEKKDKNGKVKYLKRERPSESSNVTTSQPLMKKIKKEKQQNGHENAQHYHYIDSKSAKTDLKINKKVKHKQVNGDSTTTQLLGLNLHEKSREKIKKIIKNVEKKKKQQETTQDEKTIIDPAHLKKRKKQLEKLHRLLLEKQEKSVPLQKKIEEPVLTLRQKMMQKLKAARFRFLNEQIYTATSRETEKIFRSDPEAFKAYHEGYRQQVKKWPLNPLDRIIKAIKKMPKTYIVADFGCGEARLASSVEQKVHSFDLVAANDNVTACDMAHVPLKDSSVDVAVFCLSLMGTNLRDYLVEANRVLKNGGLLKIAEVESRFDDIKTFTKDCEQFGFKKMWTDLSHNLFYFIDFKKENNVKGKKKLPSITLQPCLYKKR